jgi:hypothetical protein
MSVSVLAGLRNRMAPPREDGKSTRYLDREPSRSLVVSTRLVLTEVRLRPSTSHGFDLEAQLHFEEQISGESGEEPESGNPKIVLGVPIKGNEVALLVGMTSRDFRTSGFVPEHRLTYDEIQQRYADLVYQFNDLLFRLSEAQSESEENTREALNSCRDYLQAG